MTETLYERRHALRVQLRSYSNLTSEASANEAHLLNISETGALVAVLEPHQLKVGEAVSLEVEIAEGDAIRMVGHVAHINAHMLGLNLSPAGDGDAARLQLLVDQLAPNLQA